MQAKVGDRLVAESNKVASPRREGEIVEVRGADGGPPYVVPFPLAWASLASVTIWAASSRSFTLVSLETRVR